MSLLNLSSNQLRLAARIKEKMTTLEEQLEKILTGTVIGRSPAIRTLNSVHRKRRTLSKAARAKISAAAKKRWADWRGKKS